MTTTPDAKRRQQGRVRRGPRLRRLAEVVVGFVVVWTLFSLVYNAATAGRMRPPSGLTFIRTGDVATRYRAWGDATATGTPVVLVHGAFESADTWSRLGPLLARGRRVEAYDLKGYGYTERRPPYTLAALSDQLHDFLVARRLRRPILVAHSLGAGIVGRFVLDHPGEAGGILFLDGDGLAGGVHSGTWIRTAIRDPWRTTLARLLLRSDWFIRFVYGRACGPRCPRLDRAGVEQWRRPFQVPGAERAMWDLVGHGVIGLRVGELRAVGRTGIPAAVVFGAQDFTFPHDAAIRTAERLGAPPPTLLPHARHLTMISDPDAVAAAVERLAARLAVSG